jgi:diguanylate cyclase (GGDEF)-like protein/PAS domain S-box-containing protein
MQFRCPPGLPARVQGPAVNAVVSDLAKADPGPPAEAAQPKPFVERRQSRRVEQSWPEALDSLHRILLGYENATKQLVENENRYRTIFEDAPVGIFQLDPQGRPLSLNNAMARILGYRSSELLLEEAAQTVPAQVLDPRQWCASGPLKEEGDVRSFDREITSRDGKIKWVRLHVREIRENARILRYEGTVEDVTDRKRKEARTERLAYYDLLTGLPNRTLFHERLATALMAAQRRNGQLALMLVELDRFKVINDSLGERVGDRLLQETGDRIVEAAGEHSIVARIGGAEFAVVLQDFRNLEEVTAVAADIVEKLTADYSFLGHALNVFCNVGISLFPKNGRDGETLLKTADMAGTCSRDRGLNNFCIFTDEMNDKIQETRRIELGLREALTRNELFLVYQPQVDVRTGCITGLEALLRWNHPQAGLILPGKFIEVAEGSGLIVPIGEWVLRTACAQAKKWQDTGLPPVPIAVNVSAVQFRQPGFYQVIRNVLAETGLDPKYLELELTESLLLSNGEVMFSMLQDLRDMGIMLAIDDFGTGYSSLGYLRQFKVNRLKIARSFIQDVSIDADDAAITTAIINMARALNLSVLAEGVENLDQLSFLQAQQCYTIQGFYFSKPVAVEQIDAQLRAGFGHMASAAVQ